MSKFSGEFAAHPNIEKLFVVNSMPFTDERAAQNFQRGTDHKIEVVSRPGGAAAKAESVELSVKEMKQRLTQMGVKFGARAKKSELAQLLAEAEGQLAKGQEEE